MRAVLVASLLFLVSAVRLCAQGPPFQTDDPVPVDLHHYEFYIFGGTDAISTETDITGPAFEFNWGALPRVQLHAILPFGAIIPSNNFTDPTASPDPTVFGLLDSELGIKLAIVKESKYVPQIGTFTMFELPTGSSDKGLGVGKLWYKLPLWLQKNIGHWLLDGGAGETIVPQTGYRNFPYGAFLLKYTFDDRLELGGEVFAHASQTSQTQSSTLVDLGGSYHLPHHPGQQFLFSYGHSVAGQTENYAYAGMYWTWPKTRAGEDNSDAGSK